MKSTEDAIQTKTELHRSNVQDVWPLTPMQEELLYVLLNRENDIYFRQITIRLKGALDHARLEAAFSRVIGRHDTLRSVFLHPGEKRPPYQVVLKQRHTSIEVHDLRGIHPQEQSAMRAEILRQDEERGFRLGSDLLIRLQLIDFGAGSYELVWSYHHLVIDGWCLGVFLEDLLSGYREAQKTDAVSSGIHVSYRDYLQWLDKLDQETSRAYWKKLFREFDQPTVFRERTPAASQEKDFGEMTGRIDAADSRALRELAARCGVTLFDVLQVIWGVLLQRYTNSNDVCFGTITSGRPDNLIGADKMIGVFVRTLPVRVSLPNAATTVYDILTRMSRQGIESRAHGYLPLSEIQEAAGSKVSLFDHLLVYQNYPIHQKEERKQWVDLGFEIEHVEHNEQTAYGWYLSLHPAGDELQLALRFDRSGYTPARAASVLKHFEALVREFPQKAGRPVRELEMLTDDDKLRLRNCQGTTLDLHRRDLWQALDKAIHEHADSVAVASNATRYTYATMRARIERISALMGQGTGRVGLFTETSEWMVFAMLACLRTGRPFVPLDKELPASRLLYQAEDAGLKLILCEQALKDRLAAFTGEVVALDEDRKMESPVPSPQAGEEAYVIYTSGSTGKPKGVRVSRHNLFNYAEWANDYYFDGKIGYAFAVFTSPAFDFTLTGIFTTLLRGDAIHLYPGHDLGHCLARAFDPQGNVKAVKLTPSHLQVLKTLPLQNSAVKTVILGGEALREGDVSVLQQLNGDMDIYNEYGPTEATIGCIVRKVANNRDLLIGQPIANTRITLTGPHANVQPPGVPGEIVVSGAGVAIGYLGNDRLTTEKFMDPDILRLTGEAAYRTGDIGLLGEEDQFTYLGRRDDQVKIRGYRVETGEIERVLETHKAITQAAVMLSDDGQALVAFITGSLPATEQLREHLRQHLPEYMVPTHFYSVPQIPMTHNGKTNRKQLRELLKAGDPVADTIQNEKATNKIESELMEIWQEILKRDIPGIHSNFFHLGGHSLKVLQLVVRLRGTWPAAISPLTIYNHPTVASLAKALQGAGTAGEPTGAEAAIAAQGPFPLSRSQKRIWMNQELSGDNTLFNTPMAFVLEGNLDTGALQKALQWVVDRHDMLRASFHKGNGTLHQRVHPHCTVHLQYHGLDENRQQEQLRSLESAWLAPFDAATAPLMRVMLLRMAPDSHRLYFNIHHMVCDGWSMEIMIRELSFAYGRYAKGQEPQLPLPGYSYAQYVRQEKTGESLAIHEQYWLNRFGEYKPEVPLFTNEPAGSDNKNAGAEAHFELEERETAFLSGLAATHGTTAFSTVLAILKVMMYRFTAREMQVFGTAVSGRTIPGIADTVGCFVNLLPLIDKIDPGQRFTDTLAVVSKTVAAAMEHQEYPYELLTERLLPGNSRKHLFNAGLTWLDLDQMDGSGRLALEGVDAQPLARPGLPGKFDLWFYGAVRDKRFRLVIKYNTRLFREEDISQMGAWFHTMVGQLEENPSLLPGEFELSAQAAAPVAEEGFFEFRLMD